eukprot:GDKI01022504.1.p1 GENE.GDKI01022504.1~~GDKI01022504.1.p1  ORF type:complete len:171 (-),score=31.76 GDKI01022504.1:415-927(-)
MGKRVGDQRVAWPRRTVAARAGAATRATGYDRTCRTERYGVCVAVGMASCVCPVVCHWVQCSEKKERKEKPYNVHRQQCSSTAAAVPASGCLCAHLCVSQCVVVDWVRFSVRVCACSWCKSLYLEDSLDVCVRALLCVVLCFLAFCQTVCKIACLVYVSNQRNANTIAIL